MAKRVIIFAPILVALILAWLGRRPIDPLPPAPRAVITTGKSVLLPVRRNVEVAPEARSRPLAEIVASVKRLKGNDQAGLDRLFSEARQAITSDQDRARKSFERRVPTFAEVPLDQSFFILHAMLYFGDRPSQTMELVLDYTVPGTEPPTDPHGHAMTPQQRYGRVKAFAIRHYLEGIANGKISGQVDGLIPRLKAIAAQERSLDIAREASRLLAKLSSDPQRDLEEVLRHRPRHERQALIP